MLRIEVERIAPDSFEYQLYNGDTDAKLGNKQKADGKSLFEYQESGNILKNYSAYFDGTFYTIKIDGEPSEDTVALDNGVEVDKDLVRDKNVATVMGDDGLVLGLDSLNASRDKDIELEDTDNGIVTTRLAEDILKDDEESVLDEEKYLTVDDFAYKVAKAKREEEEYLKSCAREVEREDGFVFNDKYHRRDICGVDSKLDYTGTSILDTIEIEKAYQFVEPLKRKWIAQGIITEDTNITIADLIAVNTGVVTDGTKQGVRVNTHSARSVNFNEKFHFDKPMDEFYVRISEKEGGTKAYITNCFVSMETLGDKWRWALSRLGALEPRTRYFIQSTPVIFTNRPNMTMGVSEKYLYVGIEFLAICSLGEVVFVLMHEAMHRAYLHAVRQKDRFGDLWNIATDLYVNKSIFDKFSKVNNSSGNGTSNFIDMDHFGLIACNLDNLVTDKVQNVVTEGDFLLCSNMHGSKNFMAFSKGGLYMEDIDTSKDSVESIYDCLQMGVDTYEDVKEKRKSQSTNNQPNTTEVIDERDKGIWRKPPELMDSSDADSQAVGVIQSEAQQLVDTIQRLIGMMKSGKTAQGNPLTAIQIKQMRTILEPIMKQLHLNY